MTGSGQALALLAALLGAVDRAAAMGSDTSGTLTIVVIALASCAGAGGLAVIVWYCYKSGKTDQHVKPKTVPPTPKPGPMQPQQMLFVSPGMQGFMVPTGGLVMGLPAGVQPGGQLAMAQPVPVAPSPATDGQPTRPEPQATVEDLDKK